MSVTDDERREVARKLREQAGRVCFTGSNVEDCIFADWWSYSAADGAKSYMRLADLIEPDRDLECELELTASERTNAPVRVYECDCCGRSCDSVYAEDYVYCPFCGRPNTARDEEVEG